MESTRVRRAITAPAFAGLLVVLALLGAPWVSATQAHAAPRLIDPEPIDDVDPPFEAPPGGFDWTVPNRFNISRWNDLRDAAPPHSGPAETYDPAYVHPTQFPIDFNGCPDESELNLSLSRQPTQFTYTWNIAGSITSARSCLHRHVFDVQGSYAARLTIDGGAQPASYEQTVRVRDLLIVSLGDSYASGEGNPDIPQIPSFIFPGIDQQVDWLDDRCHRSFWAGPTQAALAIELADPKTSVTYLSFACSGATIDTETFRNGDALDPYEPAGISSGKGILGDYAGVAPPGSPPDFSNRVPSQIQQLRSAIGSRPVDAVMISAGGNDLGFGPIATVCVLYGLYCPDTPVAAPGGGPEIPLQQRVAADLATLPPKYAALATALTGLSIPPGRVYITEYPDPATGLDGASCPHMLEDVFPTLVVTGIHPSIAGAEVDWARTAVLRGLNDAVAAAASAHGWKYVGGIERSFIGHGYCSRESWIRRAADSTVVQGPYPAVFNESTTGTLHPTSLGHVVYRNALVAALRADLDLGSGAPAPAPTVQQPSFEVAWTKDGVAARFGDNGWLVGPGLLTAEAVAATINSNGTPIDNGLRTVGLAVDGLPGCPDSGLTCTAQVVNPTRHRWTFEATAEGVYQIGLVAGDWSERTEHALHEMKVDLTDPTATATPASAQPASGRWYRAPVQVTLGGSDTPTGSGLKGLEYRLDGAAAVAVPAGSVFSVSGEGVHTVDYRATDWAGRTGAWQRIEIPIDSSPPTVAIAQPTATTFLHTATLTLAYSSADAGSGVAAVAATIDGSSTLAGHGLATGQVIDLLTELTLGPHTFAVQVTDVAGHTFSLPVTFTVVATAASIKDAVSRFLGTGDIDRPGIAHALTATLESAAAARLSGGCGTATNVYGAFTNQVQAQTGKAITPRAATILIAAAQYVAAHCP